MKFCFFKRLASALEETMSVARSESSQKKSAVVAGQVLNFGTKEGTTSFEPIERPITCVSALYDARQASLKEKNILIGSFPELIDSTPH
jgi:hypothetical protein